MTRVDDFQNACAGAGIPILRYVPGKSLKVRCETHWAAKVLLAVLSLMFFAVGAQFVASLLNILGGWVRPACALLALTLWAWLSFRGVWITFDLEARGYRLRTIVESEYANVWPDMEITSVRKGGVWQARLQCAGQELGRPQRHTDRRVAEAPLIAFTSLFTSPEEAVTRLKSAAALQTERLIAMNRSGDEQNQVSCSEPLRFEKPPLVYLIHGTFAPDSPWTEPKSSELVEGLRAQGVNAEYRRFRWTGKNRVADRKEGGTSLAGEIGPVLDDQDRAVVLIGHSHGGNVALQAGQELTVQQRAALRYCFLATPFLSSNRRFDAWGYYLKLPEAIRDNLFVAVQAAALLLTFLVYISVQELLLPIDLHVEFGGGTSGWILLPALLWFFGVPWLTSRACEWIFTATEASDKDEKNSPVLDFGNSLVCAYSSDEAYMALSALSNLMSFVQIGIFRVADGVISLLRRTRLFEILFGGAWLLLWFGMVIGMFLGGILFFLHLLLGPDAFPGVQAALGNMLPDRSNIPFGALILIMIFALLLVGLLLLFFFSVLVSFGLIRFLLFWFAGVADQIRTRTDLIETWLGSVNISAVPFGDVRVYYLPGNNSFNHTEIYRDPDCHARIADFIRETSTPSEASCITSR